MNRHRKPIEHGTYAGYQAHKRRGEMPPCEPCRKANTDYNRERRQGEENRRRAYEQEQARRRALWRLARAHKTEYDALYAEESRGLETRSYVTEATP